MTGAKVLWIVQDGVLAGPGASQTVPYLRGLAAAGYRMSLLSVEKNDLLADEARRRDVAGELEAAGVSWMALPYGRGPAVSRTALQLRRTRRAARRTVRRERVDLVHARSYLPGLIALGLKPPFVFDMRGFWPQERLDGGLWREGGVRHRFGVRLERRLLRGAAAVVVLAEGAKERLPVLDVPLEVIPTAVDLDRFRPGLPPPEDAADLGDRDVFVIAGALGTWYLLDAMLDLAAEALARSDRAHLLLLTEEDASPALEGLAARGVSAGRITVRGVPHRDVPRWFSLGAAGICLVRSAPSKRASAPTKLGELLACGVPVLITPRIGDSDALVSKTRTGVVVDDLSPEGLGRALDELDALRQEGPELAARCRRTAREHLSLESAVARYAALYERLQRVKG